MADADLQPRLGLGSPAVFMEDWSLLTDDDLQAKYDAADQMQGFAFLLKYKAARYRRSHGKIKETKGALSKAVEQGERLLAEDELLQLEREGEVEFGIDDEGRPKWRLSKEGQHGTTRSK